MATLADRQIVYQAQPGPQQALLECPIADILYGGARGGGKTYAMIGDWLSQAGEHGANAKGLWLRRSMPELRDVMKKMRPMFERLGAVYKEQSHEWTFTNGAVLTLAYLESDADATRYQGWELTWLGVDDAGTWPTSEPIDLIAGSMRSPHGVPIRQVMSCNPGGDGHVWLKVRYIDPAPPYVPHTDIDGNTRVFIPAKLEDNQILMQADPGYAQQILKACAGKPWLYEAWRNGSWDIDASGGKIDPAWLSHFYDELAARKGNQLVVSVDPAEDVGKDNDTTGILAGLKIGYECQLRMAEEVKLLIDGLEKRLIEICEVLNPDLVIVEKKSVGGVLVQNLKRNHRWRWPIIARDPGQMSKAERMWAQTKHLEGGRVLVPSAKAQAAIPIKSDWADFKRECVMFTGNPKKKKEKDNRVDALSQLLKHMFGEEYNIAAMTRA